jgi:hypothetical protein
MNRHDRSGMMDMGLTATEVWATHKGWDEEMLNDRRRDMRMRNDADALRRSRRNRKRLRDASLTIGILILLAILWSGIQDQNRYDALHDKLDKCRQDGLVCHIEGNEVIGVRP